jgi:hypothetical protein
MRIKIHSLEELFRVVAYHNSRMARLIADKGFRVTEEDTKDIRDTLYKELQTLGIAQHFDWS